MQIKPIRHEALRHFAETGSSKGLPPGAVDRLRDILAYLAALDVEEELHGPADFGAHS